MLTTDSLLGKVLDIHVCVCGQLLQHWLYFCLKGTLGQRQMRVIKQIVNAGSFFLFSVIAYLCHCWQKTCDADKDNILAVKDGANLLKGLGHIEAYIGHLVIGHLEDHWQHLLSGDFLATCFWQSLRHIIGMVTNDAESEKHSKILDKCFF